MTRAHAERPVRVGQIVNIENHRKGPDAAHVVVEVRSDRVRAMYRGSHRWYMPEWHAGNAVKPAGDDDRAKAARRALAREPFDRDGWRRIMAGRDGSRVSVLVDHVDAQGEIARTA